MDTIFALATAHGKAGVAIIRFLDLGHLRLSIPWSNKILLWVAIVSARYGVGVAIFWTRRSFYRFQIPIVLRAKTLLNCTFMEAFL